MDRRISRDPEIEEGSVGIKAIESVLTTDDSGLVYMTNLHIFSFSSLKSLNRKDAPLFETFSFGRELFVLVSLNIRTHLE